MAIALERSDMKKFNNNFTTPEQSKRLLEFGVPAWTADFFYPTKKSDMPIIIVDINVGMNLKYAIPCWSVGRLMEIYDTYLPDNGDWPNYFKYGNLLEYVIDCIDVAIEKELIDLSKLEE